MKNQTSFNKACWMLMVITLMMSATAFARKPFHGPGQPEPASPRVYFTNEIPVAGIAKEYSELLIKPEGGFAYVVVDQYPNNFSYDQLKVKIYKKINGTDQLYDNKTYNISTANYYTYIKYEFFSVGSYIFDVYDKYDGFVGTGYITIRLSQSSAAASSAPPASSPSINSPSVSSLGCTSGLKEYYNNDYGFAVCIPTNSYVTNNTASKDALTINNFYDKKLEITFNNEPAGGVDKYDLDVVSMVRSMMGSMYSDFYRKEFKLLSSKPDRVMYRSVMVGVTKDGQVLQSSVFYVKFYGRKIRGYDYMVFSGPFAAASDDASYQIIIELAMAGKMILY